MNSAPEPDELVVERLGVARFDSPLGFSTEEGDQVADYCSEHERVLFDPRPGGGNGASFELAGPRARVFFDGARSHAGIVTCGGLSPGLNNIVRALVLTLTERYRVARVTGFRFGFAGLAKDADPPPVALDAEAVRTIHRQGGTVLGSSRGPQEVAVMVATIERLGIDMLFCIGGDGTMRGAEAIHAACRARGLAVAVVGLPKTIDNDLPLVERTFGFDSAVELAAQAVAAARLEADAAPRGVGLVRLMGRHAGFIAGGAALATRDADLVLIPELPFELEGAQGVYAWLRGMMQRQGRAVIVVAEGAGQAFCAEGEGRDASGNKRMGDIGTFLRDGIRAAFADDPVEVKYIDPSYMIRAAPANTADARLCGELAEDAVHAAMAGCTGVVVGLWCGRRTHVPLAAVVGRTRRVDLDGSFWRSVVQSTGQPKLLGGAVSHRRDEPSMG